LKGLQIADIGNFPYIPLHISPGVCRKPVPSLQSPIMDSWVKSLVKDLLQAEGWLLFMRWQAINPPRIRGWSAEQLTEAEGEEGYDGRSSGEGLAHLVHDMVLLGAR
jgi:hypothetical protein